MYKSVNIVLSKDMLDINNSANTLSQQTQKILQIDKTNRPSPFQLTSAGTEEQVHCRSSKLSLEIGLLTAGHSKNIYKRHAIFPHFLHPSSIQILGSLRQSFDTHGEN